MYVWTYRNVSTTSLTTYQWSLDAILNKSLPLSQDSFGESVGVAGNYIVVGSSTKLQREVSGSHGPASRGVSHRLSRQIRPPICCCACWVRVLPLYTFGT